MSGNWIELNLILLSDNDADKKKIYVSDNM